MHFPLDLALYDINLRYLKQLSPRGNRQSTHHLIVGHELQDAGCNPTPELQPSEDGTGGELSLILVEQRRGGSCLLTVDGPQLGKHKGVEQGAHVQHRSLAIEVKTGEKGQITDQIIKTWDDSNQRSLFLPDLRLFWKTN